jgi:hypothetical protein
MAHKKAQRTRKIQSKLVLRLGRAILTVAEKHADDKDHKQKS